MILEKFSSPSSALAFLLLPSSASSAALPSLRNPKNNDRLSLRASWSDLWVMDAYPFPFPKFLNKFKSLQVENNRVRERERVRDFYESRLVGWFSGQVLFRAMMRKMETIAEKKHQTDVKLSL